MAWAAALAFIAIGTGALVAPRPSAGQYGLREAGGDALFFVRALGARDLVLGLLIAAFATRGERSVLGLTLAISAVAGAADALIILAAGDRANRRSLVIHIGGTIGLLAAASIVAAGR